MSEAFGEMGGGGKQVFSGFPLMGPFTRDLGGGLCSPSAASCGMFLPERKRHRKVVRLCPALDLSSYLDPEGEMLPAPFHFLSEPLLSDDCRFWKQLATHDSAASFIFSAFWERPSHPGPRDLETGVRPGLKQEKGGPSCLSS